MLGAIAGDVIGSVYEHYAIKSTEFPLFSPRSTFTDDTVLTAAVAYSILNRVDYATSLKSFGQSYRFDVSCQGSVPQAITAFLESADVEDAIRKAISLGGDSDTLACIAGGVAQAYYREMPKEIVVNVRRKLPEELLVIIDEFNTKYGL